MFRAIGTSRDERVILLHNTREESLKSNADVANRVT
jgi:hypothetical protein